MPATRRLILFIIIILLLLLLFIVVPSVSWSQTPPSTWQEPARELAKKIIAVTGPRQSLALTVRNISSLSDSEVAAVRLALESELGAVGLRLATKPDAAPELRITLSENIQGLLWIADIPRDASREVAMLSVSHLRSKPSLPADYQIAVNKQFILESEKPILDFGLEHQGLEGNLLVLQPKRLSLFSYENEAWKRQREISYELNGPVPRDLRGRLDFALTDFVAYLPGIKCSGTLWMEFRPQCQETSGDQDVWRLLEDDENSIVVRLVPGRNFFEGALPPAAGTKAQTPPFFNLVPLGEPEKDLYWIATGTDGVLRIYRQRLDREEPDLVVSSPGWGTELSPIFSECGRHVQLLLTRPGDWTEPDELRAFEIVDDRLVAVSAPLQFPGPIISLWLGHSGGTANAVVRNLKTNRYEAYTLTLSCGR